MRRAAFMILTLLTCAALAPEAVSYGRTWRFVSCVKSVGDEDARVASTGGAAPRRSDAVSWEGLSKAGWIPSGDSAILDGKNLPPVRVSVERRDSGKLRLSRATASVFKFALNGSSDAPGPGQGGENLGASSVAASGEGWAAIDEASGEPVAGGIRITIKVRPSPWAEGGRISPYEETVENAWSILPW